MITVENKFNNIVSSILNSKINLFKKLITNKRNKHFMIKENEKEKKSFLNIKLKHL